jgi:hypothetical protein
LPDSVSQEPNQPAVQNPKRGPGRPRQEGSTAAAEAMKKIQRKDLDEASKRAKRAKRAARAALAQNMQRTLSSIGRSSLAITTSLCSVPQG